MPRSASGMQFFRARVIAITDLTPSFRRFTFGGDDLADYGDPGYDQRIKIVFPTESGGLDSMPGGDDWYTLWRELPESVRPPFRTYTTRHVRHDLREVDVDMVAHAVTGPASAWIENAEVGSEVLILAPTTAHTGISHGIDFVPPRRTEKVLLAGDETAAPAISVILEQLPPEASGVVVLEVPHPDDVGYLPHHPGFAFQVSARADGVRHEHLVRATQEAVSLLAPAGRGAQVEEIDVEEIDVDTDILWEVPRTARGGAALRSAPLYSWLAGEAGAIKALRRELVTAHGIDRRAVAFMGYWRLGRAEN